MTLRELRYFIEVYQCVSIAKASEHLYVAPSVISNSIKKLEKEFNTIFFSRSANRLTPTVEGNMFYEQALNVIAAVSKLENKMHFSRKTKKKTVCTIGISKIILSICGNKIYDELTSNFPDYEFVFTTYLTLDKPEFYTQYDIAIVFNYNDQPSQENDILPNYSIKHLKYFQIYAWLRSSSPLCAVPVLTYEMLKKYQFIIYNDFMRYCDIAVIPIDKNNVINITIQQQLFDYLENFDSFILDVPFLHGKLQYEELFKDHHISLNKLDSTGTITIIHKKNYAKDFIPLISLLVSQEMFL